MFAFYPTTTAYNNHRNSTPTPRPRFSLLQREPLFYESPYSLTSSRYDQYVSQLAEEEAEHAAIAAALHRERARLEREVLLDRARERTRFSQLAMFEPSYPDYMPFLPNSREGLDENSLTLDDLEGLLRAGDYHRRAVQAEQAQRKREHLLEQQQRQRKIVLEARERQRKPEEENDRKQQQQHEGDLYEQLRRLLAVEFAEIWSHPDMPLSSKQETKKTAGPSVAGPSAVKKDVPVPKDTSGSSTYDSRLTALTILESLSNEYVTLLSSFTFPSSLDFEAVTPNSTPVATHKLTHSPLNAPVFVFDDSLMQLLQKLDSIESNGDETVREVRRGLVQKVEKSLEALETMKEEIWSETAAGKEENRIKGKAVDRSTYHGLKADSDITTTENTSAVPIHLRDSAINAPAKDFQSLGAPFQHTIDAVPASLPSTLGYSVDSTVTSNTIEEEGGYTFHLPVTDEIKSTTVVSEIKFLDGTVADTGSLSRPDVLEGISFAMGDATNLDKEDPSCASTTALGFDSDADSEITVDSDTSIVRIEGDEAPTVV